MPLFSMKNLFNNFEAYLISLLLALMTTLTCVNVFFRYVLTQSIDWIFELNTFLFAWVIFLGAAWGIRMGSHIGVDILVKNLPKEKKRIVAIIATLACILYSGIVLYGATIYVHKMFDIGIVCQDIEWLPQWVPRMALPIGYVLVLIRFVEILVKLIKREQYNFGLADEAADALKNFKADGESAS